MASPREDHGQNREGGGGGRLGIMGQKVGNGRRGRTDSSAGQLAGLEGKRRKESGSRSAGVAVVLLFKYRVAQ